MANVVTSAAPYQTVPQGPYRPQMVSRGRARGISGRYGGNNEDLMKHSHAAYVAYVNKYNTVYS